MHVHEDAYCCFPLEKRKDFAVLGTSIQKHFKFRIWRAKGKEVVLLTSFSFDTLCSPVKVLNREKLKFWPI